MKEFYDRKNEGNKVISLRLQLKSKLLLVEMLVATNRYFLSLHGRALVVPRKNKFFPIIDH